MNDKAKIITFWSAKGGVGKTTLAIAKAIMLAKEEKDNVVILDFNEVTPDVHKMLGLKPIDLTQIYDAIEQENITTNTITPYLQKKHGVWILTGVSLRELNRFQEKHFSTIIQVLKDEFSHIVIDCNAGIFFASTLAALRNSDEIKIVTIPTQPCIEDTTMFMNFIQSNWKVGKNRLKVVLNMAGLSGIEPENVKALFDDIEVIKYDQKAIETQESGKIFIPKEMNISKTRKKPRRGFFSLLSRERGKGIVADKSV